jgi:cytochrome c553
MTFSRAAAVSLVVLTLAAPFARAEQSPDPERGKIVFRTVGGCVNCHGWAADGKTGVNLRSPPGSSLRESVLDLDGLIEVIACGRPGTAMPYHDKGAYRDDRCYGLVISDFEPDDAPTRGKTLRDDDIASLAAYLQTRVIGLGAPTVAECAEFFDNPAAQACVNLK